MAVGLLCGASIAMSADYALKEAEPTTGSNIARTLMMWPVPIDKKYSELTKEEKDVVRKAYVKLGPNDEPPYPAEGMTGILRDAAKIHQATPEDGLVLMAVNVDATGHAQGVALLRPADQGVAKAFAFVLLRETYKPALCAGSPCAGEFAFEYDFTHRRATNIDINPDRWLYIGNAARWPGM
jgi:hypothetical protein